MGNKINLDTKTLRHQILDLHKESIKAHLEKDADFFIDEMSEDYFQVSNGEIRHPSREEMRERMSSYLNETTFTEYRDMQEPIIGFSDDGSIAWSLVQVKVSGRRKTGGAERALDFTCAWINLFKRHEDKWVRLGDVSSFR